jgi:hypothetical protein
MMRTDLYLRNYLIGGGTDEMNTHGEVPTFSRCVEHVGKIAVRRSGKAGLVGHSGIF